MVSTGRFLQECVDFLFGKSGFFGGSLTKTKKHESVPVMAGELNCYVGIFRGHFSSSNSFQLPHLERFIPVYYQWDNSRSVGFMKLNRTGRNSFAPDPA